MSTEEKRAFWGNALNQAGEILSDDTPKENRDWSKGFEHVPTEDQISNRASFEEATKTKPPVPEDRVTDRPGSPQIPVQKARSKKSQDDMAKDIYIKLRNLGKAGNIVLLKNVGEEGSVMTLKEFRNFISENPKALEEFIEYLEEVKS